MTVSAIGAEQTVMDAIGRASARSGIGFDYLLATAQRESGLDCQAKSKSSSACGLYQFVAQTWLSTLKAHGAEHGLGAYADDIERTAQGQYVVSNPARQAEILALRKDPVASAALAADLTADNAKFLAERLGRPPTEGELYAAHVLGAAGASKLIALSGSNPGAAADGHFADAASRNRGLFYDRSGAPVSVAALTARLTSGEGAARTTGLRPSLGLADPTASADAPDMTAWSGGLVQAPLTLTPQVLAILSSLDMPGAAAHDDKQKTD